MKRINQIILILLLLVTVKVQGQTLTAYHVVGKVTYTDKGKEQPLILKTSITGNTKINVPYGCKVELLDEASKQRITIKNPGSGTVKQLMAAQGNTVSELSEKYVAYVKKQLSNKGLTSQKRYSDFATVTREVDSVAVAPAPNSMAAKFAQFRQQAQKKYDDFRREVNKRYTDFVRQAWEQMGAEAPLTRPEEKEVKPVEYAKGNESEDEALIGQKGAVIEGETAGFFDFFKKVLNSKKKKKTQKQEQPIILLPGQQKAEEQKTEEQQAEKPKPEQQQPKTQQPEIQMPALEQPQPIEEVKEVPVKEEEREFASMPFIFCGNEMSVRVDETKRINIGELEPNRIADILMHLGGPEYDNLLYDCLQLREKHKLCDWAYLMMLKEITDQFCGADTNEAALLMGYLYYQSGYKMRFAYDSNKHLYLLVASDFTIYGRSSFLIDGVQFYPVQEVEGSMYICKAKFPKESELSLLITQPMDLDDLEPETRTITSRRYPDISIDVTVSRSLMDFYNNYPAACIGNDKYSRWVIYAETPLNEKIKKQIYPILRRKLEGMSEYEAVSRLLNLVQTGLVYGYDDEIWGGDRTFFAEESLYYPFCDCEDRSVLFTRLVRDLLGLECVLLYYPGHLASAVHFNDTVTGDYFRVSGKDYTVCDATYINAPVGRQMPDCAGQKTIIVPIK